jgi:hypothetical protein
MIYMTPRTIPPWLAGVAAELELDRPGIVTPDTIDEIRKRLSLKPSAHRIIQGLHERGWLLKTGIRGAWEFIPAERAGAIPSGDPFLPLRGAMEIDSELAASVALGSALWLLDMADRAPSPPEIALPKGTPAPKGLRQIYRTVHHDARLPSILIQGIPVHRPATILVHLASKPTDARSWGAILPILPDLLSASPHHEIQAEIAGRTHATQIRLAYLISDLAPDLIEALKIQPAGKVWFGGRGPLRRHDARWQVADTLLPEAPARRVEIS